METPTTPKKKSAIVQPGAPIKNLERGRSERPRGGARTSQSQKRAQDHAAYKPSHSTKNVGSRSSSKVRVPEDARPNYSEADDEDDMGHEHDGDRTLKPGDRTLKPGDRTLKPGDRTFKPGDVRLPRAASPRTGLREALTSGDQLDLSALGLDGTLTLGDLLRLPLPECPLVADNISTSTTDNSESLKDSTKASKSRASSRASSRSRNAKGQKLDAASETSTGFADGLPKLSEVVFMPSMIPMLEGPMKELVERNCGAWAVDMSVGKDALFAGRILPQYANLNGPKMICTEMDIQSLFNMVVIIPANTVVNIIVGKDKWNDDSSPYVGSIGGAKNIPDTATMDIPHPIAGSASIAPRPDKLHVIVEYKTPGSLPEGTFETPWIAVPDYVPSQNLAMRFIWYLHAEKEAAAAEEQKINRDPLNHPSGDELAPKTKQKQKKDTATKVIMQVYAQSAWHDLPFMILSNYRETWFLIRKGSRLAISRPYSDLELTIFDVASFMALARGLLPKETRDRVDNIIDNARTDWWDDTLQTQLRENPEHDSFEHAGIQECTNLQAIASYLGELHKLDPKANSKGKSVNKEK